MWVNSEGPIEKNLFQSRKKVTTHFKTRKENVDRAMKRIIIREKTQKLKIILKFNKQNIIF